MSIQTAQHLHDTDQQNSASATVAGLTADQRRHLITDIYNRLDANSVGCGLLSELYHKDAVFHDPFHRIEGLDNINQYFTALYQSVESINFDYGHFWPAGHSDALRWTMTFSHPAIASGKQISVEGCTELKWQDGKVIHHRDLFDGADMLYNHLPLIGWTLGKIRERMA